MIGSFTVKRHNGRPRQRWIDIVKSELEKCAPGSKLEECVDRNRWHQVVPRP